MEWFLKVVKEHYADFNGRARRKEYWMFVLFQYIIVLAVYIVAIILSLIASTLGAIFTGAAGLAMLALLVPSIAVGVRRLHDIGKSGWMLLVCLIPFIGSIWLLIMLCTEGQKGDNEYGPDPKTGE
ncbi:DUF805 domain-containing protein [Dysgonomonas sp. BGC7]|uniref:DUF805 domain-containing protein n=1 Tax=Dysgonomonas sp. BGC7 TaxID=1658008 RepID=UPI0006829038|nr:DUF805 domain-containing protein [Dysgonomonas sp. BGC7]MBD8390022.1 DUF805 domain-containing protein [Dysgonomonas sp. BGC7]